MLEYFFADERTRAIQIYKNGFTENQFTPHEAQLIAKYGFLELGFGEARVRKFLKTFCEQHDRNFNYVILRTKLNKIIKNANSEWKNNLLPIQITLLELDTIRKIKNFTVQKIMFVFLVFSKRTHNYVYDNQLADIKKILSLNITEIELKRLLYLAYKENLIRDSNENYFIKIYEPESEIIITISNYKDLYNLSKIYENYCGGVLSWCLICQTEFVKNGARDLFCTIHKEEKQKEYLKIHRNKMKVL